MHQFLEGMGFDIKLAESQGGGHALSNVLPKSGEGIDINSLAFRNALYPHAILVNKPY
ncbi:hypothetical protein XSR1_370035 [Xenorhabdus szentirmaii DSM 16338]|uniref:Uncharacterized protein n=1 Tax=Xenorhabdus szentirmaii DSM 16338 TaxID=1427518 RepID=W1J2X9_9GAMM|nr:hypothetical protein XSR1_370035 [Xenorhabdus szentirmaii DSM 16338]